jgi:hypothetical protein
MSYDADAFVRHVLKPRLTNCDQPLTWHEVEFFRDCAQALYGIDLRPRDRAAHQERAAVALSEAERLMRDLSP